MKTFAIVTSLLLISVGSSFARVDLKNFDYFDGIRESEALTRASRGLRELPGLPERVVPQVTFAATTEEAALEKAALSSSGVHSRKHWLEGGRGSGSVSILETTEITRAIVRVVAANYSLHSMIDAPCGAMDWQPRLLEQLEEDDPGFKYYGVDIVNSVIENNKERFKDKPYKFASVNLASQALPTDYDLILSRDALQHLPCKLIVAGLQIIAKAKPKYLLVGSYDADSAQEGEAEVASYSSIDLRTEPFNLAEGVLRVFDEKTSQFASEADKKLLLISGGYLATVDFAAMKERCSIS